MKEALKTQFRLPSIKFNWWKELIFLIPILVLVKIFVLPDPSIFEGLMVGISISAVCIWFGHVMRKLMLPEFSITDLYNKALENPIASAITLMSTFYLLSILIKTIKL